MVTTKKQLRRLQQQSKQKVVRFKNKGNQKNPVDARQNIRKKAIVKRQESNNKVRLFTRHFDARNKINGKRANVASTGVAKKAFADLVRDTDSPSRNKRNYTNASKSANNSRSDRETKFTGKSIHVMTTNDLAPKERKALMKGNSLSVIAKNKSSNKVSNKSKPLTKTLNNTWIETNQYSPIEAANKPIPAKVIISNLHPNVTQEDIMELFGAIGSLQDGRLKSIGTAEVIYRVAEDAFAAYNKYHGRNLDGQPMILKITTELGAGSGHYSSKSSRTGTMPLLPSYSNSQGSAKPSLGAPVLFTVKL